MQPFDVRALLATGTDTFRALAYSNKVRYQLNVDPAMPATLASDSTRLLQILGNLTGTIRRSACARRPAHLTPLPNVLIA